MTTQTPEQRAESLVAVSCREHGGPSFIDLTPPDGTVVSLGPYENPACAKEEASRLRGFLATVIRSAAGGG